MTERYVDPLKELIQTDRNKYNIFKENLSVLPAVFQDSVTNQMTLEQLTETAESLEAYKGNLSENDIRVTADIYDDLGIITSERKTFSGDIVYRAPNYHGKGSSRSWGEIQADLEEAVEDAEKMHAWEQERSRQQQGLEEY